MVALLCLLLFSWIDGSHSLNSEIHHRLRLMESQFVMLEKKLNQYTEKNDRLLSENLILKRRSNEYEVKNSILWSKVNSLENILKEVQNGNAKCLKHLRLLEEHLNLPNLYTENQMKISISSEGNHKIQERGFGNNMLRLNVTHPSDSNDHVAFYAYLSTSTQPNLRQHHTLIFDYVKVNKGHGYHSDDGIFTVPSSGVYVFGWTVAVQSQPGWASAEIVINGVVSGSAFADGDSISYDEGTGIAIVEVHTGDHVYIRMQENGGGVVYSHARGRTSFMGWKLF